MNRQPVALGWIALDSAAPDWDAAQVRRLARRLGYRLVWPPDNSLIPLADQVRELEAEAVLTPSTDHLGLMTFHAVMCVADIETVEPRLSFARWATSRQSHRLT